MDPIGHRDRRTGMRTLALSAATLLSVLALGACGSDDDPGDVAADPAPTSATATPTAAPTRGSYPDFGPTDYTYQLTVQCFCANAGTPMTVTVRDDQVVGDDSGLALTLDQIIDKANDLTADVVKVDWPAGQDYPTSVYVDGKKDVADDEVGYSVADVQVG
ncbi:hypothetical protein G5V58_15550 [Nocardioides anomalus]|uniref:Uncharacterized protein n=1 Tax=Nocardioides anomalus TaxID=2712223 RepID=A0A6G6WG24_9ACTN|nr:DUF6174 domain-containing protein [Nocardioides anomalus]QIG44000.1 hypothetical protein G5V58_15550 [Nocardioides anomalus]